jgi:hypothetical protein
MWLNTSLDRNDYPDNKYHVVWLYAVARGIHIHDKCEKFPRVLAPVEYCPTLPIEI